MNALLTKSLNGRTVKIFQDSDPESPRTWSVFGKIAVTQNRHFQADECLDRVDLQAIAENDLIVSIPVYAYVHSGVMMRATESGNPFSCPWDSGQCGLVYAELDTIKKEFGSDDAEAIQKAKALLINEVETFSQYLNGEVYGYVIEDAEGNEIDSCWGFYGDPDELATQALEGKL